MPNKDKDLPWLVARKKRKKSIVYMGYLRSALLNAQISMLLYKAVQYGVMYYLDGWFPLSLATKKK